MIYEYHVIGKCNVSSCQKKEWTVMYCEFENFLFLSCLPPYETLLYSCINGMIFMKVICFYLSSNLHWGNGKDMSLNCYSYGKPCNMTKMNNSIIALDYLYFNYWITMLKYAC